MRRTLLAAVSLAILTFTPTFALADVGIGDEPDVRGWAMVQEGPAVTYEKDFVRGDTIPAGIKLAEVPNFPQYGFVIINTERVIVDPATRKVITVY
jgi:hypothetical protein